MSRSLTPVPDEPKERIAVVYTRVSKDKTRRRKSVTEQYAEAREAASRESWSIPDDAIFTDNHRSASRFAKRPRVGWEQVLAYLAANPVHVLVLWEVSRADRRLGPWIDLLDMCRRHNVLIHIIKDDETYDPDDSRDRKYLAMEGIEAEAESEKISKRIQRDKRAAAFDGRPHGKLNYGYLRLYSERGHRIETVLHEHQAHVKRNIIDAGIVEGRAVYAIARDLDQRRAELWSQTWARAREIAAGPGDWPTRWAAVRQAVAEGRLWDGPGGGRWYPQTVLRLAVSPTYLAKRVYRGEVIGDADWPAITDERTFRLIKARVEAKDRARIRDTSLRNQLSGAAKCARDGCGGGIQTGRADQYRCKKCMRCSVNLTAADLIINGLMAWRLRQADAIAALLTQADDVDVEAAEREERTLQDRLDAHYRESAAGRLSARGLSVIEAELLPLIEAARARARQVAKPLALREIDPVKVAATWPDQPVALRRTLILELADVRLSANAKGQRVTPWRFAESRWKGDPLTWGQRWELAGRRSGLACAALVPALRAEEPQVFD